MSGASPVTQTNILCNKSWLSVPKNLAGALRAIRHIEKSRFLWADAICINQSDNAEKEHQVQLMRTIYSQAQRTLIWLSKADDDTKHKISLFARIAIAGGIAFFRQRIDNQQSPKVQCWSARESKTYTLSPFSSRFYLALIRMLGNPWFQRAWVVQEVVVSRRATVIWGTDHYDWNDLIRALDFMSSVNFPLAHMPTLQHIASIENERARYKKGANMLRGLLLRHQRCLSTDPRDKVYAFCGLNETSPSERVGVRISYEDDVASIYREVATTLLYHDRTLDILSRPPSPVSSTLVGLPSWVPDWSKGSRLDMSHMWRLRALSLVDQGNINDHGPQKYGFAAAGHFEYSPEFSKSGKTLILEGYVFDTVAEIGHVFKGVQLPQSSATLKGMVESWLITLKSFLQTRQVLYNWEKIAKARSTAKYITGEDMVTAFWQTLSIGEYVDSPALGFEIHIWDKVMRFTSYFKKLYLEALVLPYCMTLLLWHAMTNKPLLIFELQSRHAQYRKMVKTEKGYIGIASSLTQLGDSVVLCKGSRVPLVMRPEESSSSWQLVGDAYVHGIMNGEALDERCCAKLSLI